MRRHPDRREPAVLIGAAAVGFSLTTSALGHWFAALAADAGYPDVTCTDYGTPWPPRWLDTATSSARSIASGHRDASATLKIYAHALPVTDAADTLDRLYRT